MHLSRENGDARGIAEKLMGLSMVNTALGAYAQAWTQAEEGIALFVQFGDDISASLSRITLGWVAISQPDLARARLLVEEAVAHSRARNYLYNLAQGLFLLGLIVLWQGETATAEALFKECLHLPQQPFYWSFMVLSTGCLGALAWRQGDVAQTYAPLEQYRVMDKESITPSNVATYILGLAAANAVQGEPGRAARLLGVLEAMCEETSAVVPLICHLTRVFTQTALRAQLGDEAYAVALAEGRLMTLEQALG